MTDTHPMPVRRPFVFTGNTFDDGVAREGAKTYAVEWKDAIWHFLSEADAARFAATPEAFAPQYGGHCANAMSLGKKVDADPEIWLIHNDRLYLFYAQSGHQRWSSGDIEALITTASTHWQTLKN